MIRYAQNIWEGSARTTAVAAAGKKNWTQYIGTSSYFHDMIGISSFHTDSILARCMCYHFNLGKEKVKTPFEVPMSLRDGVNLLCCPERSFSPEVSESTLTPTTEYHNWWISQPYKPST